ncbi:hypothetical protein ATSB10_04870 [Dyella thiooxydans]|uniref:Uncharacterized protein n=1 Tax=Dyella thiooxydans TaxID=445710 RepID=A0A160MXF5_9GAMM|nr:hypothetical protein [Dyella thiooxydans]AND67941.1 hypothetical protein ATSB10_04870 [Dyella thiooxydans]
MNDSDTPAAPTSLLGALDALRGPGNLLLMAVGGAAAGLLAAAAVGSAVHGGRLTVLIALLLAWLVGTTAYCAVSLRQWQRRHGGAAPGLVAAVTGGFAVAVKVLLAMLLLFAAVLAIVVAACLLFLLTQIPGIGPALDHLVFPLVAVVMGVALYALGFIAAPLATVAACDGRSITGIVATVLLVVRRRLFDTALRGMLLNLVALAVVALAAGIVTTGVLSAAGVQHAVHIGHAAPAYAGHYGGYDDDMGGAGFAAGPVAGLMAMTASLRDVAASASVLYFLAISLGLVVLAAGWVVIFEETARDLDPRALEAQLRAQAERARQGARAAQDKAARLARESAARAQPPAPDATAHRDEPPGAG